MSISSRFLTPSQGFPLFSISQEVEIVHITLTNSSSATSQKIQPLKSLHKPTQQNSQGENLRTRENDFTNRSIPCCAPSHNASHVDKHSPKEQDIFIANNDLRSHGTRFCTRKKASTANFSNTRVPPVTRTRRFGSPSPAT